MGKVVMEKSSAQIAGWIEDAVAEAGKLLKLDRNDDGQLEQFRSAYLDWDARCCAMLEGSFSTQGVMTSAPVGDFRAVGISLLDLRLAGTSLPRERVAEVERDIREKVRVLGSIRSRLEFFEQSAVGQTATTKDERRADSIFVVHGHDLLRREKVRRFLETVCDRNVVVLDEQPNEGRDILGKLLTHALSAAFAVVIMSPDDEGRNVGGTEWKFRARQNVILELGLFLGLLGRNRVVALYDESVEMPSDYSGVLWIPMSGEGWQLQVASEMKAAGIEVSLDKLI